MNASDIIQALTAIILAGFGWWLAQLSGRVKKLEEDVGHYEANVGIGNEKLESIKVLMEQHIDREENQTWTRIDRLAGGLGEALHKVEVRLTSIDAKIQRVGEIAESSADHIDEHDRQAEPWKRRIERVEHDVEILKNGKNDA